MCARRITSNSTGIYLIALVVIVIAFFLLGGGPWMRGMMHGSGSIGLNSWNWPQILISMGIGFLIGILVSRR